MPSINGTSTAGVQTLVNFATLSVAQFEIIFPGNPILPFKRVGYLYIFALDQATPFQTKLLVSRSLYRPGNFVTFPNNYGFVTQRYSLQAAWDVPGLSWRANYV